MTSHAPSSHQYSKGIVHTFYTILIAFIAIAVLVLFLVLFVQQNLNVQLTIQETEQDRAVINLAQAILSSSKLVYEDPNTHVLHRGLIDFYKARDANVDDIRKDFGYTGFYYTLTITDLEDKRDIKSATFGERPIQFSNDQKRIFPVAIRYVDSIHAGILKIEGGFAQPVIG